MKKGAMCGVLLTGVLLAGCGHDAQHARKAEAQEVAKFVAGFIDPVTIDAEALAEKVLAARDAGKPRREIKDVVAPLLLANPDYMGFAVAFEPDAYDGKDDEHRYELPESDDDGRFAPYFFKLNTKDVDVQPMQMADSEIAKLWYEPPLQTMRPVLGDPIPYPVGGVERIWVAVTVPILDGDVALGAAGIDVDSKSLLHAIAKRDAAWPGSIWIISDGGNWLYHPNVGRIGYSIDAKGDHAAIAADELAVIDAYRALGQSASVLAGNLPYAARIRFAGLPQEWTVIVSSQSK